MLAEACLATPSLDISAILNGALRMGCQTDYMKTLANLQETASTELLSPNSDGPSRKRRRGDLANPANTLDGLVARKATDSLEPYQNRFLPEHEAIIGPDDDEELNKIEKDPDVSTRTCSACGYQGKWISEMIRHKRVHMSDRPFKCRFCNRTSKWKADLIRHVAKTHGIRVLTKHSRSKTFDANNSLLQSRPDDDKPRVFACDSERQSSTSPMALSPKRPLSYRCALCFFEQEGLSLIVAHVRSVHNVSPYECRCGISFDSLDDALGHQKTNSCSDIIANVTPIYNRGKPSSLGSSSPDGSRSETSSDSGINSNEIEEDEPIRKCAFCPFEGTNEQDLLIHTEGHVTISDLDYKCAFCNWKSEGKSAMEAHLRLHSVYPMQFLASSEQQIARPKPTNPTIFSPLATPSVDLNTLQTVLQLQARLASMSALLSLPSAFTPVLSVHNCRQCDARFRDPATLLVHERFHGFAGAHLCPICDYGCNRGDNLLRHIQTHHTTGPLTVVESLPETPETNPDELVDVEM